MACSFCALQATYVSVYDTAPLIPPPSIFCKRIPGEVQLSWSHSTGSTFGAKVSAVGPPCSTAPGGGQCGRAHRRRAACPKAVGTRAGSSPRGTAPAREPKTAPAASKSAPSQLSQQSLKQPFLPHGRPSPSPPPTRRRDKRSRGHAAGDTTGAEQSLQRAIAVARGQNSKFLEIRAATTLARLWRNQGKFIQARDLLAPIYGWFTEGFDTPVLQDAKALLDELRRSFASRCLVDDR
jgi:hypothetical protein